MNSLGTQTLLILGWCGGLSPALELPRLSLTLCSGLGPGIRRTLGCGERLGRAEAILILSFIHPPRDSDACLLCTTS